MKPTDAFEELASIVVGVVKRPYREEAISWEEWDSIAEQVAVFIGKQKARCHGDVDAARTAEAKA